MNDNEQRVKELEAQLAAVTAERDELSARLDAVNRGGFSFDAAMARIAAKQKDNDLYRQQMEAAFEKGASETTKYI